MSLGSASRSRPTISWILLILANVLWACSYVAAKFVLRDISANMINALRMISQPWYCYLYSLPCAKI